MIVLDMECEHAHQFEGWFASSEAFEAQREKGLISCPICGSQKILRRPSAPHVARPTSSPDRKPETRSKPVQDMPAQALGKLLETLRQQADKMENVGTGFAEEARKIHYGEARERPIRGQASIREAADLIEEGINILPLPQKKEDLN